MKLTDYIKQLNANVADVATNEKAKRIRKKLIVSGAVLTVIGVIGVFVCFILFATAGFDAFGENGFTARILVPFFLFPVCGVVAGVGAFLIKVGLSVLIGGEAAKFIDKTVNNRCPQCGKTLLHDELFCSRCGTSARLTCRKCGAVQEPGANYCKKCSEKL